MKRKKTHKPHLLTIDFETFLFEPEVTALKLTVQELRNLDNGYTVYSLEKTLEILKQYNQKVTFFVVLKLEKLFPGIIQRIKDDGHEVGWHGYEHKDINTTKILEEELKQSRELINTYSIEGFQAPRIYFIREGYAYLKKYNFLYSSSIYGNPNNVLRFDSIYEIPVSTSNTHYTPSEEEVVFPSHMSISNLQKYGIPYGSSYFWSILGEQYYMKKIKESESTNTIVNLFMHNWQLFSAKKFYKAHTTIPSLLYKSPLFVPYRVNILPMFTNIISSYTFQTCREYVKEKKHISYLS